MQCLDGVAGLCVPCCECVCLSLSLPACTGPRCGGGAQEADSLPFPSGLSQVLLGRGLLCVGPLVSLSPPPEACCCCCWGGAGRRHSALARTVTLLREGTQPLSAVQGGLAVRSGHRTLGAGTARPPAPASLCGFPGAEPGVGGGGGPAKPCAGASRNTGWSGLGTGVNKLWSENHRAW